MRKSTVVTVAAIAAIGLLAVAVPPLVDWSGTRDQIAARATAATGRPVRIDGRLSLRLLPGPALAADNVVIGNPEGMPGELVRVERLRLRLAFLPLLTGKIQLRSAELDHPVVTLARGADGQPNWHFGETKTAPASQDKPPQRHAARPEDEAPAEDKPLPVSAVTIRDGVVQAGGLRIEGIDADVSLGTSVGPFRVKGSARLGGAGMAVEAAMDRLGGTRGSPASLSLSLPGEDAALEVSGLISHLSGGNTLRGRLTGKVADPSRTLARLGAAPLLPPGPLALSTELSASATELSLSTLELSAGDARVAGAIAATLGGVPQVDVRLSAAKLDLDQWKRGEPAKSRAGAKAEDKTEGKTNAALPSTEQPAHPAGGSDAVALPRDIFVSADLGVDDLSWRGQQVRQMRLEAVLDGGEVMLRQASARLPGDTDLNAEGAVGSEGGKPVFDGTVRLKSDNAAALLSWLGAGLSEPRKLELTSPLRLAWPDVRLADFRLNMDGAPARGDAALRLGEQPGMALTVAVNGMDVMVKGRLNTGKAIEDGAFKLTSSQGLRPLRAFGINTPGALDRLGPLSAEGSVAGTSELIDLANLKLRVGPNSTRGQVRLDLRGTRPSIAADLNADTLALDGLLPSERSGRLLPGGPLLPPNAAPQSLSVLPAAAGMVGAGASPFSRDPLDLSGLHAIDARLALAASTVTARGWRLDNAALQANLQNGTATIEKLSGRLLGGELSATAKLDAGKTPSLAGQFSIAGADLGAAKLAAAGMTVNQGRMDADARFATGGRSTQDMAAKLTGDAKLTVRNGVLDGFDLPAVNRQMGNLRNIGSVLGLVQAGMSGGRTPFSSLAGTFRADNGVITSRDLKLEAEGGGATADSTVNLPEWSTRTNIAFHLAAAPQTPVGLRLEGSLENPRKIIDLNAIQQHLVTQGLGRALGSGEPAQGGDQPREKNTGKNILKNLLKGLGGQ